MFSAIQDEVRKMDQEDTNENIDEVLEDTYNKLYDIKVNLEDLDTNQNMEEFSNDDFNKLKDLVVSGKDLTEAYRNVLPANVMNKSKNTIRDYEEELIDSIVSSEDVDDYRANLEYIINNLSTIYEGKEYNLTELKQSLDNKYN